MLRLLSVLVLVLTIGVGNVWGADESVTFSAQSYSNQQEISSYSGTNFSIVFNKGTNNSNPPKYFTSGTAIRAYGGNYFTVSSSTKTITKIELTFGSSDGSNAITTDVNTYSNGTWTGSASSVKFTIGGTSGNRRLAGVAVTYASSKTLSSISVQTAPTKTTYTEGETFDPTGLIITRTYSDKTSDTYTYAGHTSDFTFSPTTSAALTTSNTSVSITYGGKSTSQSINVYNVTLQARDEDGNTIPAGGPGAPSRTGKSISPAADANNYVFKEWSISGASLGSSKTTKSNTITNPTGAVTVTAVYYKPITITYKANGETFTTQTYGYGGTLAFPASGPDGATYSCTGKTFVGWVGEANKNYSHASTAPTYATAGGSVTEAATYYAVFATASTGSGSTTLLSEDFSDCDSGDNTTTGGSGSAWSGNDNIPTVNTAYKAGEAVKLGGKSATGYFVTKQLTAAIGDQITIAFKVKGWSSVEGNIQVSGNNSEFTQPSATTYSATMSGSFESKSVTVTLTKANPYIKIATTAKRAFIDDLVITKTGGTTYSNFETNCCTQLGSINGSFF